MGKIIVYLGSQELFITSADDLQGAILKVKRAKLEFRSDDVWGEFSFNGFYQIIS